MNELAIVLCVALGVALSELVLFGLLVAIHSAKDWWDARKWRKAHPNGSSRLGGIAVGSVGHFFGVAPPGNIIWANDKCIGGYVDPEVLRERTDAPTGEQF